MDGSLAIVRKDPPRLSRTETLDMTRLLRFLCLGLRFESVRACVCTFGRDSAESRGEDFTMHMH